MGAPQLRQPAWHGQRVPCGRDNPSLAPTAMQVPCGLTEAARSRQSPVVAVILQHRLLRAAVA
eukprot:364687-Chlamydomonas_euryale.AAC.7